MRGLGELVLTIMLFAAINAQHQKGNGYYAVDERNYDNVKKQCESSVSQYESSVSQYENAVSQNGNAAAYAWAQELLSNDDYGKPIAYSPDWYGNLPDVEKIARTIYSEGGTAFADEENGVACVILNRAYAYSQSVENIVLGNNQFAALTGDETQSRYAREPATNTPMWEHSTYLACLLLTADSKPEWEAAVENPIGDRLCFSSYSCAKNCGETMFRDNAATGNIEYCDGGVWKPVKNVYVIGYGNVSGVGSLFSSEAVPDNYSRNIFYEYQ